MKKLLIDSLIIFFTTTVGFALLYQYTGVYYGNVGIRIIVSLVLAYLNPIKIFFKHLKK